MILHRKEDKLRKKKPYSQASSDCRPEHTQLHVPYFQGAVQSLCFALHPISQFSQNCFAGLAGSISAPKCRTCAASGGCDCSLSSRNTFMQCIPWRGKNWRREWRWLTQVPFFSSSSYQNEFWFWKGQIYLWQEVLSSLSRKKKEDGLSSF